MRAFVLLLITLVCVDDASACTRCRRFGTACIYAKPVVAAVAPVVQTIESTDVFVIQSNYPAPLVGQGTSAVVSNGGYQSLTLPLFDPSIYFSQSLQLIRAANDTNALQHERTSSLVERVAALQAPAVERLAAGQAASSVLRAAGLDPAHNMQGNSSAVVINRDAEGRLQVLPLSTEQIQSITSSVSASTSNVTTTIKTTDPQLGEATGKFPMLQTFCAKCHGTDVAQPGGGFYLGDDPQVVAAMRSRWFEITDDIGSGKMPKAGSPQPSDEQKARLIDELQAIIKSVPLPSP